jgi:hypothetical protein
MDLIHYFVLEVLFIVLFALLLLLIRAELARIEAWHVAAVP